MAPNVTCFSKWLCPQPMIEESEKGSQKPFLDFL